MPVASQKLVLVWYIAAYQGRGGRGRQGGKKPN